MNLHDYTYVPALKWRQGEYQALLKLTDDVKNHVAPLFTLPQPEYDFETQAPKCSKIEQCEKFITRFPTKWGSRPCWLDFDSEMSKEQLDNGLYSIEVVFRELQQIENAVVPVTSINLEPIALEALSKVIANSNKGLGIRVKAAQLNKPDIVAICENIVSVTNLEYEDIDLIIDLESPNFEMPEVFANMMVAALKRFPWLSRLRSVIVLACSFPESMSEINKNGDQIPRNEWAFYMDHFLPKISSLRQVNFGDYTIVHTQFTAAMDMRMLKPAAKIVYTDGNTWKIMKGGAFRDNPSQMQGLCRLIEKSSFYRQRDFSDGDLRIYQTANGQNNNGNMTTWKTVGINHHITHVVDDLANYFGVSSPV